MYGKIYIDVVFVTNLLMDYMILRLTGMLLRYRAGRGRYLAGAFTGALFPACSCAFREHGIWL